MAKGPPKKLTLDNDEYHAQFVGRTKAGRQFFLTNPFVPADDKAEGREFIALYVFDKGGNLQSAAIEDLGPRSTMNEETLLARRDVLLATLGDVKYQRIQIVPFRIEMFGVEFGFIPQQPEELDEEWSVIVEPGNVMCFWPPWSSGDYDT